MPRGLKILIYVLGILVGGSVLFVLGLLGYLTLTEFKPGKIVPLQARGAGKAIDPARRDFTFITWNIGYAGMGHETDFFYDGGKMVIPEEKSCSRALKGIREMVKANDTADFIFLQETDTYAKRSWYINEVEAIASVLPKFTMFFAKNYDCRFVPMPIREPMGRVVAGLEICSRFKPVQAEAQYYDAFFPWPQRLAFLKRCFILLRFGLNDGKELVIINTHNSAFDSTGALRKRELATLDSTMRSEYQKGNYVITGGDWNSNPRGFKVTSVITGDKVTMIDPPVEPGFLPGWQFIFDPDKPSNRFADIPYKKGVTRTTTIDFFVVSPNVEVKSVATISTGFAFSDHDPVVMGIRLK